MSRVLMLHGWGFPAAVFSALEELMPAGTEVISPERPGYGKRQGDSSTQPGYLMDTPTLVIGWSLGSQEAMRLALQYPEYITGLVLLAGTPCFVNKADWQAGMDATVFNDFRTQVEQDSEQAMKQFIRLNSGAVPDRMTRAYLGGLMGTVDRKALLAGLDELMSNDLRPLAALLDVPVLLLHARDDRVVPVAASNWLARSMQHVDKVEYSSGGHAFLIPHADDVAARIGEML